LPARAARRSARTWARARFAKSWTPCTGAYLASFQALGQLSDLVAGEVKALVFGVVAALVASYKGMTAGGGPKGVGDAVNQSVVITFMLLFAMNFVITAIYFQLIPQKGS
jgi:phospholipid/cholesterol/gamma-HCH transport system permease protein